MFQMLLKILLNRILLLHILGYLQYIQVTKKDLVVLAGLLRIIELTIRNEDVDILLPIVKAGLADKSSMVQEAAIMVIEQWRTKNCLEALETSTFHSKMIEVYANQIIEELKEELL